MGTRMSEEMVARHRERMARHAKPRGPAPAVEPHDARPEKEWTEKELLEWARDIGRAYGWRVYHTYDSRNSEPGFPDLIMIKDGVQLAVETKTLTGRVTSEQADWLLDFAGVREVRARVVRPDPGSRRWLEKQLKEG